MKYFFRGFILGICVVVVGAHLVKQVSAVPGELIITGTSTTLTGDITSARLLDQANTDYFIDPAASGTSLTTAGKVAIATTSATENFTVSGNIGFTGGGKIKDNAGSLQLQAGGTGTGSTGTGGIYFLNSSGTAKGRIDTTVSPSLSSLTVSSGTTTLNSTATTMTTAGSASGQAAVTVVSTTGFSAGDLVLIIQMKGTGAGNYELRKIVTVDSNTQLTVDSNLSNSYTQATNSRCNASDTNCSQVINVPVYQTVTMTGGTLTAPAWSSSTGVGGVLWLHAKGAISITGGTVDMNGKGFSGGSGSAGGSGGAAGGGSGGCGPAGSGGSSGSVGTSGEGSSGGAGGAAGSGGTGGPYCQGSSPSAAGNGSGNGGAGGSLPSVNFTSTIAIGSGGGGGSGGSGAPGGYTGGAGGNGGSGGTGGTGGTGGGIIGLNSRVSLTISATARAIGSSGSAGTSGNGGAGGSCGNYCGGAGGTGGTGGGGGGGAGGSLYLNSPSTDTTGATLQVAAGTAGSGGTNGGVGQTSTSNNASAASITISGSDYGTFYMGSTNTASSDLAEYYVSGDPSISAGDVVAISNTRVIARSEATKQSLEIASPSERSRDDEEVETKGVLQKSDKPYDRKLIGIISTNPGVLMGSIDGENKEDKRMLALAGRVPVKIDPDSKPIAVGDFLTSSSRSGLAAKATRPGYVVARALESWSPGGPDRIEAFISLSYYMGDIDPWGNLKRLEVDSLKTKTLEVGGLNVLDEINELKRRLEALERK